ncbi:MAG: hypothetical protein JWO26_1127 [Rhodospirillales bacterium]|nr:hypothetical protein [Rhodospirillales bacterium]
MLVLGPILGPEAVGRLCIALAMLLPALGFILLGRMVAREWHPMLLLGPLLAMNSLLALGFLKHQIAVELALLSLLPIRAWRAGTLAKLLQRAAAGALIAVVHPFGAVALAGILGTLAMGADRPFRPGLATALLRALVAGLPTLVAVFVLAAAPHLPGGDHVQWLALVCIPWASSW